MPVLLPTVEEYEQLLGDEARRVAVAHLIRRYHERRTTSKIAARAQAVIDATESTMAAAAVFLANIPRESDEVIAARRLLLRLDYGWDAKRRSKGATS